MSSVTAPAEAAAIISASFEAIPSILRLIDSLEPAIRAAICIVTYGAPCFPQTSDLTLSPDSPFAVTIVRHGEAICNGGIYMAPSGRFLEVTICRQIVPYGRSRALEAGPPGQQLLISAARAFGSRAIVVILSGCGDHGAQVLPAAKACGATIIVEDPETAESSCMPKAAIATGAVDYVLPAESIASKITELVRAMTGAEVSA